MKNRYFLLIAFILQSFLGFSQVKPQQLDPAEEADLGECVFILGSQSGYDEYSLDSTSCVADVTSLHFTSIKTGAAKILEYDSPCSTEVNIESLNTVDGLDSLVIVVDGMPYTHVDTDTYAEVVSAPSGGIDPFGNSYVAGQDVIELPGGTIVCIPSKDVVTFSVDQNSVGLDSLTIFNPDGTVAWTFVDTDTFAEVVSAPSDGIDPFGNDYVAGQDVLELPGGTIICIPSKDQAAFSVDQNAAGLDSLTIFNPDGTVGWVFNDTDTFVESIAAAADGTDIFGNDYSVGDTVLKLPDGSIVCVPSKDQYSFEFIDNSEGLDSLTVFNPDGSVFGTFTDTDTFAQVIVADADGVDAAGNDYIAGDELIQLPSGDVICAEKVGESVYYFNPVVNNPFDNSDIPAGDYNEGDTYFNFSEDATAVQWTYSEVYGWVRPNNVFYIDGVAFDYGQDLKPEIVQCIQDNAPPLFDDVVIVYDVNADGDTLGYNAEYLDENGDPITDVDIVFPSVDIPEITQGVTTYNYTVGDTTFITRVDTIYTDGIVTDIDSTTVAMPIECHKVFVDDNCYYLEEDGGLDNFIPYGFDSTIFGGTTSEYNGSVATAQTSDGNSHITVFNLATSPATNDDPIRFSNQMFGSCDGDGSFFNVPYDSADSLKKYLICVESFVPVDSVVLFHNDVDFTINGTETESVVYNSTQQTVPDTEYWSCGTGTMVPDGDFNEYFSDVQNNQLVTTFNTGNFCFQFSYTIDDGRPSQSLSLITPFIKIYKKSRANKYKNTCDNELVYTDSECIDEIDESEIDCDLVIGAAVQPDLDFPYFPSSMIAVDTSEIITDCNGVIYLGDGGDVACVSGTTMYSITRFPQGITVLSFDPITGRVEFTGDVKNGCTCEEGDYVFEYDLISMTDQCPTVSSTHTVTYEAPPQAESRVQLNETDTSTGIASGNSITDTKDDGSVAPSGQERKIVIKWANAVDNNYTVMGTLTGVTGDEPWTNFTGDTPEVQDFLNYLSGTTGNFGIDRQGWATANNYNYRAIDDNITDLTDLSARTEAKDIKFCTYWGGANSDCPESTNADNEDENLAVYTILDARGYDNVTVQNPNTPCNDGTASRAIGTAWYPFDSFTENYVDQDNFTGVTIIDQFNCYTFTNNSTRQQALFDIAEMDVLNPNEWVVGDYNMYSHQFELPNGLAHMSENYGWYSYNGNGPLPDGYISSYGDNAFRFHRTAGNTPLYSHDWSNFDISAYRQGGDGTQTSNDPTMPGPTGVDAITSDCTYSEFQATFRGITTTFPFTSTLTNATFTDIVFTPDVAEYQRATFYMINSCGHEVNAYVDIEYIPVW